MEYFLKLKGLWEKLNSHRPFLFARHRCRCHAVRKDQQHTLEEQAIQFLTNLNDTLSMVRTQVLLMDPLPSINFIYFLVI